VIGKVGGSVDRVNGQLDKVDRITDSAVDAAESVADFQASRDWRHAVRAGKEAAARRELDLADELRNAGT
jgi:membrane-bound lytic murein transglycosylase B